MDVLNADYIYADSLLELSTKIDHSESTFIAPPEGTMPKKFRDLAKRKIAIVEAVEALANQTIVGLEREGQHVNQTSVLRDAAEKSHISLATYYNYKNVVQKHKTVDAIAASMRRNTYGKTHRTKTQEALLIALLNNYSTLAGADLIKIQDDVLMRTGNLWIDPSKCDNQVPADLTSELLNPTIKMEDILANPDKRKLLEPLKRVSRGAFYEFVRWYLSLPDRGKEITDARYGEGAWDKTMRMFDSFVYIADKPLLYVFADHCLLDVFIVDNETRQQRKRLWLTVLIDAYTRCVLGKVLLYKGPSIESIQLGLKNTIWPKTEHQMAGIKGDWPCYGIPVELSMDNAWGHHSISMEDLARLIGHNGQYTTIDIRFRRPYMGRQGALIERYFGNLSRKIKTRLHNAGAILSSNPKDVHNAAETACLLYEDVERFVLEEIISYQNTPHEGLNGMTPNAKWAEYAEIWGSPLTLPRVVENEHLFWIGHPKKIKRTSKGLALFGMHYKSNKLAQQPKHNEVGNESEYSVRYDPLNLNTLAVWRDSIYIGEVKAQELKFPDGSYKDVSESEREMAKDLAVAAKSKNPGREWLEYLHKLSNLTEKRQKEQEAVKKIIEQKQIKSKTPKTEKPSLPSARVTDEPVYVSNDTQIVTEPNYDEHLAHFSASK